MTHITENKKVAIFSLTFLLIILRHVFNCLVFIFGYLFLLCIVELRPSYYWIKLGLVSLVIVYYFKNWKVNLNNKFYKYWMYDILVIF